MNETHQLIEATLGTLDLSCGHGFSVPQYDLGYAAPRPNMFNRTYADGTIDYTRFAGPRTVQLTVDIDGRRGNPSLLRDRLFAYLQPDRRVEYRIQEPNDTRVRRMILRASQGGVPISHQRFNQAVVAWECPTGVIESVDAHVVTVTPTSAEVGRTYDRVYDRSYASSAPSGAALSNAGTKAAEWQVRMTGPLTNPVIGIDGHLISFTANGGLVLTAGQTIVIDSIGHQVFYDDGVPTPALQYVAFATSDWVGVPGGDGITPRTSNFTLTATSFGAAGAATITYRDTWT